MLLNSSKRKKISPINNQRRLLNVYGDEAVDVSTVRRWVMGFSNVTVMFGWSTHEMFIADKNYGGVETCTIYRGYCARFVYCSCRRNKEETFVELPPPSLTSDSS